MAKSILNVVMQGASGKIGQTLVFRRMRNGQTIIANRAAPRTNPLTPNQEAFRERFRHAAYMAKKLVKDPMYGPLYQARVAPGKTAYNLAMTDCLTLPKIKGVSIQDYTGAIGDQIVIRATDDFMVTQVKVRILAPDNTLIEEGMAALDDIGEDWNYVATVINNALEGTKVEVTAIDIPRNETVEVVTINANSPI